MWLYVTGVVGGGLAWATPTLVVEDDAGEVLVRLDLTAPTWILRWNHSVTGIVVSDYYALQNGVMMLTDSHTPAFDAGLGHIPGRGRLETAPNHGYWIVDIDEPVPGNGYWLRVGSPSVDHRIVHNGTTYSLSDLASGERVYIYLSDRLTELGDHP